MLMEKYIKLALTAHKGKTMPHQGLKRNLITSNQSLKFVETSFINLNS
jgi:hypothetical protein